ncbi:MAG: ABC transporter substrate-binding protein [Alphaproteobacteria bacterium]|nr:ABC transporter substrate-binding protein [Alphaproteobacteria bacterium]
MKLKFFSSAFFLGLCFLSGITISFPSFAKYPFQPSAAMHGEPKYKKGFSSFDYVNVSAPNGGELKQASFGSFDTFNPFSINGVSAAGIGLTHDSLMKQSEDEAFSLYGLIADGFYILPQKKGVSFRLNKNATFNDGSPITPQDVLFSFNILKEQGSPTYRYYYRDVEKVEIEGEKIITFYFVKNTQNKELPFILGELPILSKSWWEKRDFSKTSLEIPVSSGPYIIDHFQAGRYIVYKKNPTYWAWNLNVNKGYYHFDKFRFDYYRDTTVAVEAFKAGEFDIRLENEAKKWVNFQNEKNVQNGRILMKSFSHHMPSGMQGFVFNLRKPIFQDKLVRQALLLAFDFNWMNNNLFHGLYTRTTSFFDNSNLKAPSLPDKDELKLLEPYKNILDEKIFSPLYQPEEKNPRKRLYQAMKLLNQAGWTVDNKGILKKENIPFEFEILIDTASSGAWERIILPYIGKLKRLGITAHIRAVDLLQYKNRLDSFEYDMIVSVWGQSLSPGNEQRYFFSSSAADSNGSMNYSGIKNPAVDAIIEKIISANSQKELETAIHALDRILLTEIIVIPHWYSPQNRYMFQNNIRMPQNPPLKGTNILTWWKI